MSPTAGQRLPHWLVVALSLAIAAAAMALLRFQVARVWPYFSDDSFISLRYAQRLLEGHGLTWNDGERVEGYSNLLWVLGCSGLGALGIDLVTAARILGATCALATFALLLRAFPPLRLLSLPAAIAGPLLLAASPQLQVWTCGGLEGPMVLLFVTWGAIALLRLLHDGGTLSRRRLITAGLPFALLCLTRPDGPLWVATTALAAGWCWHTQAGTRTATVRTATLCVLPGAAVLAQLTFRLLYYRDFVPNTAHVKAAVSGPGIVRGLEYVGGGLLVLSGAILAAAPALLLRTPKLRCAAITLLSPLLLWCAYLTAIGGDHFLGWRHLIAPLGALALLASFGLRELQRRPGLFALAAFLALAGPALLAFAARVDPKTNGARDENWEWQGEVLGTALGRAFVAERPLLAVDAAGALPYFSQLPCLDMLGLNDRTIATQPSLEHIPASITLPPGHTHGNGAYVMDRQPDLLLFNPPPCMPLAVFVSGYQFQTDRRFLDGYRCALLELPTAKLRSGQEVSMRTPLWLRVDGKVGVHRGGQRIEVPAILLGSYRQPHAFLYHTPPAAADPGAAEWAANLELCKQWFLHPPGQAVPSPDGRLVLELRANTPAVLEALDVPAGRWRLLTVPLNDQVTCAASAAGRELAPAPDGAFDWPGGKFDVACRVKAGAATPQRLDRVVLQRQ